MRTTQLLGRVVGPCLLAAVLVIVSAAPADAVLAHEAECRRITRQINHFEDVASMAAERRDEMWFDGTVAHIKQLAERRVRLCPEYAEPNYARIYAEWAMWMMRRAADVFLAYTTFGTYGAF